MGKVSLEDVLDDDELDMYEESKDICAFEKYCGNCDNFNTEKCSQYYNPDLDRWTEWRKIGCKNFED